MTLPTPETAKFLLGLEDAHNNQSTIGAALRVLAAYAEGQLVPAEWATVQVYRKLTQDLEVARLTQEQTTRTSQEGWGRSYAAEEKLRNMESLLEAAEEARDMLRESQPGTDEWNLSWSLEGALDVARGRDPLTGLPLGVSPVADGGDPANSD